MAIANVLYYIVEYTFSNLADVSEKRNKEGHGGCCVWRDDSVLVSHLMYLLSVVASTRVLRTWKISPNTTGYYNPRASTVDIILLSFRVCVRLKTRQFPTICETHTG
jgi:hypothetical protein